MALAAVSITVGQSLGDGRYSSAVKGASAPAAADTTDVAADIATLVADGASPTQAHVTTLDTDWTTLLASINAVNGLTTAGDVTIMWDGSVVTSRNQLLAALRIAVKAVEGGYGGLAE